MNIHLRLRLILGALFGALLVLSLGTALQFREIAISTAEQLGPDARLLESAAEMQRLLGSADRGPAFEASFRTQLDYLAEADTTEAERELALAVQEAFEQLLASGKGGVAGAPEEQAIEEAVAVFTAQVGREATQSAETVASQATTAAVGLGIAGVLALAVAAGVFRTVSRRFLQRLTALDRAAVDIQQGDGARRASPEGDDELARIARTLNFVLDLRDETDAEMSGRNRVVRALLVALLRRWPESAAILGIDGGLLASTLSGDAEGRIRSLTPQLRKAAGILLSRGFVSPAELETDVSFEDGSAVRIRALVLDEQRFVGWLAEFVEARRG